MKFIPHEYQKYAIDRVVADPALGFSWRWASVEARR